MARKRLTNNSDETDVSNLLAGDSVFVIPYFQRPYKWKPERLRRLQEDLLNVVDGQMDSHFFGAIIIHGRRSNPSDPTVFEIIDGQQRVTTVFLYIAAAIKFLCKNELYDEALGLFQKYISLGRSGGLVSNLKLHSCKEDRVQMNSVVSDLLGDVKFSSMLGSYTPKPLPSGGVGSGQLLKNYKSALRFFDDQFKQGKVDRVRSVYSVLLDSMSLVQIDVMDPTDGPRIFDSLNSRQEPMTVGDLIRNEVFSRVVDEDASLIEETDRDCWQPFYERFTVNGKNHFDSYFFPFGLILNPALSKSQIFDFLHKRWSKIDDPVEIVAELQQYQNAFLDLVCGGNRQQHETKFKKAIERLNGLSVPSSVYPFIMKLSYEVKAGCVSELTGLDVLERVETFLLRRAICGIEPTGLHVVFKGLWQDVSDHLSSTAVERTIRGYSTVSWPDDEVFSKAIRTRALYKTAALKFFLSEYNLSLGGDVPLDGAWVEHVLPQKMSSSWTSVFSTEQHKAYVDTVANLILLSSKMNGQLSNKGYWEKRKLYKLDSMFKSARTIAEAYSDWTPETLESRAADISNWALSRWPNTIES